MLASKKTIPQKAATPHLHRLPSLKMSGPLLAQGSGRLDGGHTTRQ